MHKIDSLERFIASGGTKSLNIFPENCLIGDTLLIQ